MSADTLAMWIGYAAMVAGGLILISAIFAIATKLITIKAIELTAILRKQWSNMESIHRVDALQYWFDKMKNEGIEILGYYAQEKLKEPKP